VAPIIARVPNTLTNSFAIHKDALALYTVAYDMGLIHHVVEVGGNYNDERAVRKRPRHPRKLSESSIWGQITDIDEIAAQWGG
jgi:hypothetical protein